MSILRTKVTILFSALALLLAGSAVGLSAGEASAASVVTQSSSNPAEWNWPTFQQGSSGLDVRTIQYLLNARGAGLAIDGIFGPRTNAAVRSFQGSQGLAIDGIVGQHTWSSLLITVQRGSTGSAVRAAQDQLTSRNLPGDRVLVIDGIFGPKTESAVLYFQTRMDAAIHHPDFDQTSVFDTSVPYGNFAVDGIVGPLTWFSLVVGYFSAG